MKESRDSKLSKSQRSGRGQVALPEDLSQRLTAYATTAGAVCAGMLGLAPPAQADIIVNNHPTSIGVGSTVPLQINGVTEFRFRDVSGYLSNSRYLWRNFLTVSPDMGNVLGRTARFKRRVFVSRLGKGAVIGSGGAFAKIGALVEGRSCEEGICGVTGGGG